jgi:hypothetical protein
MCARLLYEKEPEWTVTARELQSALQEHMLRMANLASAAVVAGKFAKERRND